MATTERRKGLYRNPVSFAGAVIAAIGMLFSLLAIVLELSLAQTSPYIGIFTYILLPGLILFGAVIVLLGMRRESKRRERLGTTHSLFPAVDLNNPIHRRRFGI